MFEEFLEQLAQRAEELQLEFEPLKEKYERRYQLGLEAGLTEEEIVQRFGDVKNISMEQTKKKRELHFDLDELKIEMADSCDVEILEADYLEVLMDQGMKEYYQLINDGRRLIITGYRDKKIRRNESWDDLTIYLPRNCFIRKGEISLVSSDLTCEGKLGFENFALNSVSGDSEIEFIKAKKCDISTVSGDVEIETLAAIDCDISTVSADVEINEATIKNLHVSTISGDIEMNGIIDQVDSSSISGDIEINHMNQRTSLKDTLGSLFKF